MPPVTIDFSEPIPLFPLAQCLLLPGAVLPLHIFEPRYRRLTAHALGSRRLIAMAMFDGDSWRTNYHADPPLRPCVCIGVIFKHEQLDSGLYNIVLAGVARATIAMELPNQGFRQAILRPADGHEPDESQMLPRRLEVESLLDHPPVAELASVVAINRWRTPQTPTSTLIDRVSLELCRDNEQRYRLLAEESPIRRAQWLEDDLRKTRRSMLMADRFRPPPPEHYATVN